MAVVRRSFLVKGTVQGVGFRHSAARTALRLGLVGWVRNLPDGSVEVHAQGEAESVATMEDWLREGPPMATVTRLIAMEVPPETGESSFTVRYFR
ncbi:MAG: acylphosphatase [Synergistaceae bacterium]|nr:acylphosphatase [Synergistota bacterium]NLM71744.1 acylphosphatase [Synergistaceae bacterium]